MSQPCLHLSFLSMLILFFIVFTSNILMITALVCRPDQIQALMQFKNEFESNGCNRSDYLNGVRCDNSTGAVTKLQLPSGCFNGILRPNSRLFGFNYLRYLNLSHNNFTSTPLPSEFSNLTRLEVLSLSSNSFTGQVPSSFSNLIHLTHLNLSHNELTGSFPLMKKLTKLLFLDLSYNQFSGNIPSDLLHTMPLLSHLDLKTNRLTGTFEVPNSSCRLVYLSLGQNQFEGKILKPISKLINLNHLDVSSLNTTYSIDLNIFSPLKSLLVLHLSRNKLLPSSLNSSNFPLSLESLVMPRCDITQFPNILKTLHNLQHVDISSNRIKGKIPEWFWKLPHLSLVNLVNNSFTGFEGSSSDVFLNSSVQLLDFAYNSMAGEFPIPPPNIIYLSAWNNSFTGNIPLQVCNRSSLTVLDLSYNKLTGPIPQCLSNIKIVNLRKNSLEGSIPDAFYIGALTQTLDVGYNRLTGKLPRSLFNCSFLRFLSVDNNRIEDTFPFWLKALPNLQVFTLRSNRFFGHLSPPDQGPLAFPELRILELSDNSFTGSLKPSFFVNWKASSSLKMDEDGRIYMGDYKHAYYVYEDTMDLQYKGLFMEQGKVLTSYNTIDFSGNKLEGHIPESIGLLKALIALNLSNNGFTGHIPLSLANVTELESLDLSRNHLSGTVPKELGSLSFLAYVSVAHNNLMGEIPQGPQFSGQAETSFEGNAGLCGLPLQGSCFDSPTQQPKEEDEEEEEGVLNWKAVVIGYGPGLLFGLIISHVIASYKPKWYVKIVGTDKHKEADPVTLFMSMDSRWDSFNNNNSHVERESDT